MVAVKEFSWEEVSSPDFGARAAWREAVAAIAEKAKAKLPECNGRVDKAVAIVLNGDVELLPMAPRRWPARATARRPTMSSTGTATARTIEKAPHNFCKHRLSAAIARRAQELTKAKLDADTNGQAEPPSQPAQPEAPTAPLPEAPVSITLKATLHGHEVMVTLRGVDFASVKAQVEDASQWLQAQSGHTADDHAAVPQARRHETEHQGQRLVLPAQAR